jgi:putative addiction module killer protein
MRYTAGQVEVRQTADYRRWFDSLRDGQARSRVAVRIRRLSLGNVGDARSLGQGLWELRVDWGPGYRVYFAWQRPGVAVLLAGGDKRTQVADIDHARRLRDEL